MRKELGDLTAEIAFDAIKPDLLSLNGTVIPCFLL